VASHWRTSTVQMQSVVVEACWCPMEGVPGGDLHEIVDLHDGRVAIVVGDVTDVGTQPGEAAEDLRSLIRRSLGTTRDPHLLLAGLDEAVRERGGTASVICAVVDPAARVIRVSNAGGPPLVFVEGVTVELYDGGAGPPLGDNGHARRETARELRPETAVFAFTEGLVDHTELTRREAIDALVQASHGMAGASAWASEFARRATGLFGQPENDATVMSVRLALEVPPPGEVRVPRSADRVVLRAYLDPRDLRSRILLDVLSRLGTTVHGVELGIEVIDVTSKSAMTEEAGVLAAPTILRVAPEPPVRVIGWYDSPAALAKALQLPVVPADREGTA
jgi:hypothetical protein